MAKPSPSDAASLSALRGLSRRTSGSCHCPHFRGRTSTAACAPLGSTINSPGAEGLRIGLALAHAPSGLTLRFRGSAVDAAVYGPLDASHIAAAPLFWSPLLDGDTAVVELALPQGVSMAGATIRLPMLSHLAIGTAALKQADPLGNIGASGPCEIDVACIGPPLQQQAATAIDATARILLVDHGSSYLCTGTLLNDSALSLTPYLYTANHCIDNDDNDVAASRGDPAAVAQTFETFWRFQTDTCGVDDEANVNFSELTSGATLLARGVDYDWALVRLNQAPPAGAAFAAWNGNGVVATGVGRQRDSPSRRRSQEIQPGSRTAIR